MKKTIEITGIKKYNQKAIIEFCTSKDLNRYFNDHKVYLEYDFDIDCVPDHILAIPAICNIIQVAWVTDSDFIIESIDKDLLDSLKKIKNTFKNNFKDLNFNSKIIFKSIVDKKISGHETIQLFSGGLDSTIMYIRNIERKPHLSIIDYEPAGIHKDIIDWAKNTHGNASLTRTNIYSFLNRAELDRDFGAYTENTWWGGMQHGMGLLGLTAPITFIKSARKLLIASTHSEDYKEIWGSDPCIDNLLGWAGIKVEHQDYELDRQQKIQMILKPYIQKTNKYPLLIVCNSYARKRELYNCSKCAKCAQSIISLCIENIDPRKCGFDVTEDTFLWIKESLQTMSFFARKSDYWTWEKTYHSIPKNLDSIHEFIPGTINFLEWFHTIDLRYEEYFNNTTVMKDRPCYVLKCSDDIVELVPEL